MPETPFYPLGSRSLLIHLPRHAAMVVHFAYLTGMRVGKIFQLTWDKVDLTNRVIRLEAKDTKTAEPRVVFLCDQAYDILREAGKALFLEHNRVFT
jgi:integrase